MDMQGLSHLADNPVIQCAEAAKRNNFRVFGVGRGQCFSASNDLSHYKYGGQAMGCHNGIGSNIFYGIFLYVIDLYEMVPGGNLGDSTAEEFA